MNENFADLYNEHKRIVLMVANSVLRNRRDMDVEDICQDVFLKAYTHIDEFNWESSFKTWITRITINHCLGLMRQKKLRPSENIDDHDFPVHDRMLLSSAARHDLKQWIEKLTPHRREAIELHFMQGFTAEEVAMIMGVSQSAAKSAIFTGKRSLKEIASVQ